jgi:Mg2+/citrate symporter
MHGQRPGRRRGIVKELRIRTLAAVFVVAGVLSWAGARLWNAMGTLPRVPLAAPIVLALIAVVLLATALSIRSRLKAQRERRADAKGVDPLMAARAVVFGQASALVAALVAGLYGGTGVFLLESLDLPTRRDQAIYAGFSVLASLAVIAAALFLERVCKLPEDDEHNDGTAPTT